ncbi:hypothetical protein B0J12DRAFT_98126 [Macrophomina phaseolina]|uniref:Uncharacterized protein n=1 Tax=Macrophomina phaseolina TaxID=35725 RepID=A0ABQ8G9T3_9PEZI|nr:hypothetical protein B0J12DRAFT_98126 [Macrophomina phaseolina]
MVFRCRDRKDGRARMSQSRKRGSYGNIMSTIPITTVRLAWRRLHSKRHFLLFRLFDHARYTRNAPACMTRLAPHPQSTTRTRARSPGGRSTRNREAFALPCSNPNDWIPHPAPRSRHEPRKSSVQEKSIQRPSPWSRLTLISHILHRRLSC